MKLETFACQGKTWTREELPDCPVKVSRVEPEGRYCPTVSVTWEGKHLLSDGERKLTVERSTVTDAGKLGTSISYTETVKSPGPEFARALAGMGYRTMRRNHYA